MLKVEVDNLVRTYPAGSWWRGGRQTVRAVDGLSFTVEGGEVVALLGPNGAGKTTTVRVVATLLLPTQGSVRVLGMTVGVDDRKIRERIAFLFGGDRGLYGRLSGSDNLLYFSALYGLVGNEARRRCDQVLDAVGLAAARNNLVVTYSRGMRQRLHIARTLLNDPEVILLDEPTLGLDPVAARELRTAVSELARSGRTILLTTHYMLEAQQLADRVLIIDHGRTVTEGRPRDLIDASPGLAVIEVEGLGISAEELNRLHSERWVSSLTIEERGCRQLISIQSPLGEHAAARVAEMLDPGRVSRIDVRTPTLEDVYVSIIGGGGGG